MTKTQIVKELDGVCRRLRLYQKTCGQMADEAPAKSRKRADLNARAEVWHGAALEVEQAIAVIKARPAKANRTRATSRDGRRR